MEPRALVSYAVATEGTKRTLLATPTRPSLPPATSPAPPQSARPAVRGYMHRSRRKENRLELHGLPAFAASAYFKLAGGGLGPRSRSRRRRNQRAL